MPTLVIILGGGAKSRSTVAEAPFGMVVSVGFCVLMLTDGVAGIH
jgi:hypothetical protein